MNHGLHLWNVHLEPYGSDAEYQKLYDERYMALLRQAEQFFGSHEPSECLVRAALVAAQAHRSAAHPLRKAACAMTAWRIDPAVCQCGL